MTDRNQKSQLNQDPRSSSTKFVLTSGQSTAIMASTLIGAGFLTLPRTASTVAHQSSWIIILFSGFMVFLVVWVMTKLGLRFPGKTFVEYVGPLLGVERMKWLGRVIILFISLPFILVWLSIALVDIRTFGEVIVTSVLTETPIEMILGTLLLAVLFFLFVEIEVVGRFNLFLFPMIVIPTLVVSAMSLEKISLLNILPIVFPDIHTLLYAFFTSIFSYQGFSLMVIFLAFTQRENNVRAGFGGIMIPAFIYTLIIFSAVGVFGYEELGHLTWPTLDLIKSTGYETMILERIESAFVAVWVIAIFTTVGNMLYSVCFTIAQLLPTRREDTARKWIALGLIPIVYWLAMMPDNIYQVFGWTRYVGYGGVVVFFLILFLFLVAVIRKKGKGTSPHHGKQRQKKTAKT